MKPFPKTKKEKEEDERLKIKLCNVPTYLKATTGVMLTRKTIYNWMVKGKKSYQNETAVLKHKKIMGQYYTTREDIEEFLKELEK